MASLISSSIAGALLPPLSTLALNKLVKGVTHYLSKDQPSSSSSSHEQVLSLLHELMKQLEDVKHITEGTLRVARLLQKQDKSVAYFYKQLRDALYEAEDLADDFEYLKLQEEVENINRSQASTSQSIPKKPRLSWPLDLQGDTMITNLREVIEKLKQVNVSLRDVIDTAKLYKELSMKDKNISGEHAYQNSRESTSTINESKIYGRDEERDQLIRFLKEPFVDGNVFALPIVGMGGIGKTTLIKYAFNNREVTDCFDEKVWICVSDNFKKPKIIEDMVNSLCGGVPCGTNLNHLEGELQKNLQGKSLLLVLDDVWSHEWTELLTLLESARMRCAKIVLTTRETKVLRKLDEKNKIVLKGLKDSDYWQFFVRCAFGGEEPEKHLSLQQIGKQIVKKLKGSPLAAKTIGRLLERNLNAEHWNDVLQSNLWELGSDADGIMSALALSYNHLPEHLQQCFVFCSMFPKDYEFERIHLIEMWIAQGFVLESEYSSKTVEKMGEAYFDELVARCFIESRSQKLNWHEICTFSIHDLLHDLAQSVSSGECYACELGQVTNKIPTNVRHLYLENLIDLRSMCEIKSLRTLVIRKGEPSADLYEALKSIRILVLLDFDVQKNLPAAMG